MKSTKNDRRSQRTRQLLHNAMIELMLEKHYDAITVQDIIDRANVGRSTFYAHYFDKEDLLTSQLETLGKQMQASTGGNYPLLPVLEIFRHAQEGYHYRLYRALVWAGASERVFKAVQAHLDDYLEIQLQEKIGTRQPAVPIPVVAHSVTGTFLNLLKWWLEKNMPFTPEQMADYFQQLVLPGVQASLDIEF